MNMHPHAWPLYTAAKMLGLEFTQNGAIIKPVVPLETYHFASPLLGFEKTQQGFKGWYAPSGSAGTWTIAIHLHEEEVSNLRRKHVNGYEMSLHREPDGSIEVRGEGAPNKPLQWSITT